MFHISSGIYFVKHFVTFIIYKFDLIYNNIKYLHHKIRIIIYNKCGFIIEMLKIIVII